jgi:hypothetical protein
MNEEKWVKKDIRIEELEKQLDEEKKQHQYDNNYMNKVVRDLTIELEKLQDREEPIPVKYTRYNKYEWGFSCLICNTTVKRLDYYCNSCGQKLDWSELK